MTAADRIRLLNYALPVARFLRVQRVRLPAGIIDESGMGAGSAELEPAALRPAPEGLWSLVVRAAHSLSGGGRSSFVLDADVPVAWLEPETPEEPSLIHRLFRWGERKPRRHPLAPLQQSCPADLGLSSFLKGVWYAPDGHLILADWLEDQFGPSPNSTALRASTTPPSLSYGEVVAYDAFRWRWLARDVVLYVCRCSSRESDPPRQVTTGVVVGLLHGVGEEMPRRWARWLRDGDAARRLAAEMGATLPQSDEPWVWL